jgi:flavin reductase (DIM6/NTAB) family NADH-FMN oxidoreductase RutF
VPAHLLNRLLYANPACALVTTNADGSHNGMTLTWLTPVDAHGAFLISLNARRHSLANLRAGRAAFSLSPAVEGLERALLSLGSCSGADGGAGGKLARLGLETAAACAGAGGAGAGAGAGAGGKRPRAAPEPPAWAAAAAALPALAGAPARLVCVVRRELPADVAGHALLLCDIVAARVRADHWVDGKRFATPRGAPRLLSFQGSGVFSALEPLDAAPGGDGGGGGGGGAE